MPVQPSRATVANMKASHITNSARMVSTKDETYVKCGLTEVMSHFLPCPPFIYLMDNWTDEYVAISTAKSFYNRI